MSPSVSIIVPIYNAEKTLPRCIESILAQDHTDFELLLVNDGSQDSSGAICDEYAATDPRIHVIHKGNSGVSDSRNLALDQAQGTYLQFLDSDDWITPDATSSLLRIAEERHCDMVIADFYRVVGDRVSHKGDIDDDQLLSREEFAGYMMENPADFYYGVLWNKLYRREIVERHHLRMNPEINWCEDFMFNLEYIRYAQTFCALQVPIYYYVKTKGSLANQGLTISKTVKMKLTVFEYYHDFFRTVLDEEEYVKSRMKVYRFLIDAAGDGAVPPPMMPNSKKLGNERIRINADILKEGLLLDAFLDRKLLERHLETAALKNDLVLTDVILLFTLQQVTAPVTRRELADLARISRSSLAMTLQKLSYKKLLDIDDTRVNDFSEKRLSIMFLSAAEPILADINTARANYEAARVSSLSPQERTEYAALRQKVSDTAKALLQ